MGFVKLKIKYFIYKFKIKEERTLDCSSREGDCVLIAPNAKVKRDPNRYKCRREPMPQTNWNILARNSKSWFR